MFSDFPVLRPATLSDPVNVVAEAKKEDGVVMSSVLQTVTNVVMDMSSVLRIIKHAQNNAPHKAFGSLFGMQIGSTIEVSTAVPSVITAKNQDVSEDDRMKMDAEDEEKQIQCVRNAGMGSFPVGKYTAASHSSYFNTRNLHEMMKGQKNGDPCVLVVYDPLRTSFGKLYLRAFTATPAYYTLYKNGKNTTELLSRLGVEGVLHELPIRVNATTLQKMLLRDHFLSRPRDVANELVATNSMDKYAEKHLQFVMEGMETLGRDIFRPRSDEDVPPMEVNPLMMCQQLEEQAEHLVCMCKSVVLSLHFARQAQ